MIVSAHNLEGNQVEIHADGHTLLADELPKDGTGLGPNPYKFLLAALAACKIMTVQMYARRKEWPLTDVRVSLEIEKMYARDCEDCMSGGDAKVDVIHQSIQFGGDLTDKQLARLEEIADRCPVHRTLTSETKIRKVSLEPAA